MKTAVLVIIGTLFVGALVISAADAFEKGENRISNGDFEDDTVGLPPEKWEVVKSG